MFGMVLFYLSLGWSVLFLKYHCPGKERTKLSTKMASDYNDLCCLCSQQHLLKRKNGANQ